MRDEHFGISVVEFMAAGAVVRASPCECPMTPLTHPHTGEMKRRREGEGEMDGWVGGWKVVMYVSLLCAVSKVVAHNSAGPAMDIVPPLFWVWESRGHTDPFPQEDRGRLSCSSAMLCPHRFRGHATSGWKEDRFAGGRLSLSFQTNPCTHACI